VTKCEKRDIQADIGKIMDRVEYWVKDPEAVLKIVEVLEQLSSQIDKGEYGCRCEKHD
jgi:hypothetical protein